jgi:hypothetical protein
MNPLNHFVKDKTSRSDELEICPFCGKPIYPLNKIVKSKKGIIVHKDCAEM